MYRVSFDIAHRGCWATEASAAFKGASFVLRESVSIDGHARDITCVRAKDAKELEAISLFLSEHPSIRSCEVLDAVRGTGFFLVEGEVGHSLIDVVTKHRGFRIELTRAQHGRESWSVGVASKAQAAPMLDEIATLGELDVRSIVRSTFLDLQLSDAQRRVLRAAIAGGYYERPRRTSPTKIAKELKLAKSTVLEHLQKGEARLILGQEGWI